MLKIPKRQNLMCKSHSLLSPSQAPIAFLVAKDRSGTTLLQTMLDSHPQICAPLESRFVMHLAQKYKGRKYWPTKVKERFIKDLFREEKMVLLWELDLPALKKRIARLPEDTSYGDMCKQVYVSSKSFHPKESAEMIVDKNPIYALMIPQLREIFPQAKFIHLVRDYRGTVNSIFNLYKKISIRMLGLSWTMTNLEIEKSKHLVPEAFFTIRYEDLLDRPQEELEKLLHFLGMPFHKNMLTYHSRIASSLDDYIQRSPSEKIRRVRDIGIAKVHKNLSRPLDNSFKEKWRENLSLKQIEVLESCCGGLGTQYGYPCETQAKAQQIKMPSALILDREKLRLYYRLPIWLRELKSKPSMPFIPKK